MKKWKNKIETNKHLFLNKYLFIVMIDISIVLPIYNASKYLLECIESCIHQTFNKNRYEIVCCDDGSTDGSLEILNKIKLNNFKVEGYSGENQIPSQPKDLI